MNLLNEAAGKFPQAVSFLAGRPPDEFVDSVLVQSWMDTYLQSRGSSVAERRRLGQYCDTNGLVREVVAPFMSRELLSRVTPGDCMITNGAQEGMLISLLGLCGCNGIAVTADPTYIGFVGAAELLGISIESLPDDDQFVARLAHRLRVGGGDVACVYLVPDYANPTGRSLTREERLEIIRCCDKFGATIIEDTAYRRYRYENEAIPTIYELAQGHGVVLLESFAKSLLPGLRVGVLIAPSQRRGDKPVAEQWSSIKSYISVATSPLNQAALAGFLLDQNYSLDTWMIPRINRIRKARDILFESFTQALAGLTSNLPIKPAGGFFYAPTLDREFSLDDCIICAREARVLAMPMKLFSPGARCSNMVRLAFSNVDPSLIAESANRFGGWLRKTCEFQR